MCDVLTFLTPLRCCEATQSAGAAPTPVASTLIDRLKPMAAAVERMLNTVSCCVDRLQVHLRLPCTSDNSVKNGHPATAPHSTSQNNADRHSASDQAPSNTRDSTRSQASASSCQWCLVLSVGSLKLVDTSDCFMAPLGVVADAAATLDPDRSVEVSKSLFWDDLSIRVVPDRAPPAPHTSPNSAGDAADASCAALSPLQHGSVEAAMHRSQDGELSEAGSLDAEEPETNAVHSYAEDGCTMEAGARAARCRVGGNCSPRGDAPCSECGTVDDGAGVRAQGTCGEVGTDNSDCEEFRDAEEQSDGRVDEEWAREEGIVLLTGAGGGGWRGKATVQLGWAPVAEGSALRSVRTAVESCDGCVVALTAEKVAGLAEAAAALAEVAEEHARACARETAAPPIALADVTVSMLGALRPGQGMRDVLAATAEDEGEGNACGLPGEASCMTEMHDARSVLASSTMTIVAADQTERPVVAPSLSWQLRVDLKAPAGEAGVAAAVPALSVSIWDAVAPVAGTEEIPFGLCFQLGSITARADKCGSVPLKVSSRLQGVPCLLIKAVTIASAAFLLLGR